MFDKLTQFNAINFESPNLLIKNEDFDSSESLLDLIDRIQANFNALKNNTLITQFDELHLLGITQTEAESRISELYKSIKDKNDLKPTELIALGELIGELNALNRYAKSLMYHQKILEKGKRLGNINSLKTLAYLRTVNKFHRILMKKEVYKNFDDWSVISAIDLFLRKNLEPECLISEHKSTQKIAKYLNIKLKRGKRSAEQEKYRDEILSYFNQNFSAEDCIDLNQSYENIENQKIKEDAFIEEKGILNYALTVAEKVVKTKEFKVLKANVSIDVLVKRLVKELTKKFGVSSFSMEDEAVYTSNLRSKIPHMEPYYFKYNIKPRKLYSIHESKLDEIVFKVFKNTPFK